jgi:hypothetical protein
MIIQDFKNLQKLIKQKLFKPSKLKITIVDSTNSYVKSTILGTRLSIYIDPLISIEYITWLISYELTKYNILDEEGEIIDIKIISSKEALVILQDNLNIINLKKDIKPKFNKLFKFIYNRWIAIFNKTNLNNKL